MLRDKGVYSEVLFEMKPVITQKDRLVTFRL